MALAEPFSSLININYVVHARPGGRALDRRHHAEQSSKLQAHRPTHGLDDVSPDRSLERATRGTGLSQQGSRSVGKDGSGRALPAFPHTAQIHAIFSVRSPRMLEYRLWRREAEPERPASPTMIQVFREKSRIQPDRCQLPMLQSIQPTRIHTQPGDFVYQSCS